MSDELRNIVDKELDRPPLDAEMAAALELARTWANEYTPSERTITGRMGLLARALLRANGELP